MKIPDSDQMLTVDEERRQLLDLYGLLPSIRPSQAPLIIINKVIDGQLTNETAKLLSNLYYTDLQIQSDRQAKAQSSATLDKALKLVP